MTSKELNEILNKTRRTPKIELSAEQVEELVKDLEKLEYIKLLLGNYNNGKLGYINFTQEVIEVLNNDK